MIKVFRKSKIINLITLVLIINFINLTANFYHPLHLNSVEQNLIDPIDTLAEIVVEFIFEMDNQIIPDTEVPNEKRKIPDIKLVFTKTEVKLVSFFTLKSNKWEVFNDFTLTTGIKKVSTPPPELFMKYFI
ncbi:hypothetical protein Belba_3437 [Belliella baltica DSM 15883]|uniref:Uncharacterized protein n=1 Tax=Belliella baltica (strain DSM 15883 / CIP 108006 / LMG 21964 / BA134) TaxID=866536 RepID=I3Z9M1_BELBD|nr:hypothetical protein [Belliella baltica]AFL85939.1 hypothetical protein Belba_3437 [Belliella baltica DSM 15883]